MRIDVEKTSHRSEKYKPTARIPVHAKTPQKNKLATQRQRERQRVETKRDEAQIRRETAAFVAADSCADE
ncbi:hypothetical protein [Burkholderia sp. LMG 32019]|uniref:hypothetical protein n=1 Tax=Burkholderia sp. LMG 32019 TaxID=3158173 RepID=UPI003C30E958